MPSHLRLAPAVLCLLGAGCQEYKVQKVTDGYGPQPRIEVTPSRLAYPSSSTASLASPLQATLFLSLYFSIFICLRFLSFFLSFSLSYPGLSLPPVPIISRSPLTSLGFSPNRPIPPLKSDHC